MNQELKKRFEERFTYTEQTQDPLTGNVYRHREFNPNNLITIVDDVYDFFATEVNDMLERVRLKRKPVFIDEGSEKETNQTIGYNQAVSDLDEKIKGEKI